MNKKVLVCLMALMASVCSWGAVSYTITGNTITFSGTGALSTTTSWRSENSSKVRIIIQQGVTSISANAFNGMSKITSVTIPISVTSIGKNAFLGTAVDSLFYAGSPSQWASITFTYKDSHPFTGSTTNGRTRKMYFYGNRTTPTAQLVILPTITDIKKLAFYHCAFDNIHIPGTITNIRDSALYCTINNTNGNSINCRTAPTLGSHNPMITGKNFYIPTEATGYTSAPWSGHTTTKAVSGTVNGQSWSLGTNGTLTISGSGALTTSFAKADGTTQYPYYYFRYLVDKVVITGGITGLSNILQRCSAVREIEISQDNIPTSTVTTPTDYIYSQITLRVTKNALFSLDPTTTPWSGKKYALSESVTIDQDVNNATLFTALHKLTEPFNMNLTRSMSNAYYNTFCSPINMDASLVTSTFGAGTKIYSFAGTSYDEETDALSLNFYDSQNTIEAGVPYLIWPGNNVSNPSFTDVNPSDVATAEGTVEGTHATFYGTLAPVNVSDAQISAKSFIFLQANNILNYASEGTLGGMRAYWLLTGDVPAIALSKSPVMRIVENTDIETGVENVQGDNVPCTKVMRDGQLYIMYKGTMYNVQGQKIGNW